MLIVELSVGMKGVALLSGVKGRVGMPEFSISGVVMQEGLNFGNSNMWSCSKFPRKVKISSLVTKLGRKSKYEALRL